MSELSHYIKLRSSLSGCNAKQFECDKYLDCDSCLEDKIKEHDKKIKAEVIDECNKKLDELERNYESCYGTEIIEMYADVYEEFRKWLKEKEKWIENNY